MRAWYNRFSIHNTTTYKAFLASFEELNDAIHEEMYNFQEILFDILDDVFVQRYFSLFPFDLFDHFTRRYIYILTSFQKNLILNRFVPRE